MITSLIRLLIARSLKPFIFDNSCNYDLNPDADGNLGLYIHIPFCKKLCSFCPYYKVEYDSLLLGDFYRALIKEIKLVAALADKIKDGKSKNTTGKGGIKKDIESIYFGGGSPALAIDYLPKIIGLVKSLFNVKGNMGIELHPADINETLLEKLKQCGFNMVSIGIQSFQDRCLTALGRERINGTCELKVVKEFKFDVVDVDLIFGIPGQTEEDLVSDFIIASKNGATQISTYPFIEFSYTGLKNKPLNRRLKKQMLESLLDISEKSGYIRNSIWTFSKGDLLQYSSVTRDNFIGFGPGAATLLKDIFKINTFSVEQYIKCLNNNGDKNNDYTNKNNKLPTALSLKFNPRVRALYWIFWSAYKLYIDEKNFYELFSKKPDNMFKFEFYLARKFGYIGKNKAGYKLTERGAYLFHLIEQAYTHQYIDKVWKSALRNPWPEKIALY